MLELLERSFPIDEEFTLQQVYPVVQEDLQRQYPNNTTITNTIRGNLIALRKDGVIEFVDDNGTYRWANSRPFTKDQDDPTIGTLYVLKDKQLGGYKIGISRVIKDRLKALKVGEKATVIGLWESPNYCDLERMLHERYRKTRIPQSEWFALSKDELYDVAEWLNENASQQECSLKPRKRITNNTRAKLIELTIFTLMIAGSLLYTNYRIDLLLQNPAPIQAPLLIDLI